MASVPPPGEKTSTASGPARSPASENDPFDPTDPSPIALGYGELVDADGRITRAVARQLFLDAAVSVDRGVVANLQEKALEPAKRWFNCPHDSVDPNNPDLATFIAELIDWAARWNLPGWVIGAGWFTVWRWIELDRAGLPIELRISAAPATFYEAHLHMPLTDPKDPSVVLAPPLPRRRTFPDSPDYHPYRGTPFSEYLRGHPSLDPGRRDLAISIDDGWNPRRETRAAARRRILARVKDELKELLDAIEDDARERGDVDTPRKFGGHEHFEWLARHLMYKELYAVTARKVNREPQTVTDGIRAAAELIGLKIEPGTGGRPQKPSI